MRRRPAPPARRPARRRAAPGRGRCARPRGRPAGPHGTPKLSSNVTRSTTPASARRVRSTQYAPSVSASGRARSSRHAAGCQPAPSSATATIGGWAGRRWPWSSPRGLGAARRAVVTAVTIGRGRAMPRLGRVVSHGGWCDRSGGPLEHSGGLRSTVRVQPRGATACRRGPRRAPAGPRRRAGTRRTTAASAPRRRPGTAGRRPRATQNVADRRWVSCRNEAATPWKPGGANPSVTARSGGSTSPLARPSTTSIPATATRKPTALHPARTHGREARRCPTACTSSAAGMVRVPRRPNTRAATDDETTRLSADGTSTSATARLGMPVPWIR